MEIQVAPGEVNINAIALVRAETGCRVYMVDFLTKRPALAFLGSETGDPSVLKEGLLILEVGFEADEETLRANPGMDNKPSTIKFVGLADDWKICATVGKYSAHIFLWQDSQQQFHEVWASED